MRETDNYVTREVHEEFRNTLKAENDQQNKRLDNLETTVRQINQLTISVEKLAVSMDGMLKELTEQSNRLKELEGSDGKKWKKVVSGIITGVIGGLVVFVMAKLGLSA